jgi:hypothetical protein
VDEHERRARRRDFIRTHHPDRGGDPATFISGLAQLDRVEPGGHTDRIRVTVIARPPILLRVWRALGRRHRPPRVR